MTAAAKLIRRHLHAHWWHGITHAAMEALNTTIQWVKKTTCGFRNLKHFNPAIDFQCGGLDLSPTHTTV